MACTIEQESPSFHPPPLRRSPFSSLSLSLFPSSFPLGERQSMPSRRPLQYLYVYPSRIPANAISLYLSLGPCLIRLFDHASSAFFHTTFVRQGDVDRLLSISRILYPFLLPTRACSLPFSFFFFLFSRLRPFDDRIVDREERKRERDYYIHGRYPRIFLLSLSLFLSKLAAFFLPR